MAPLPSLARLSLRPAPVGRYTSNEDGTVNWGLGGPPEGYDEDGEDDGARRGGTGPPAAGSSSSGPSAAGSSSSSAPGDDEDVFVVDVKTAERVEEEKKKRAMENGDFIELTSSDDEDSAKREPKVVKREGNGKQPANPVNPVNPTNPDPTQQRQQLDQEYTLKQQEAINQTTNATSAFLNGNVDNGLAFLAQARESGARMKELKDRLYHLGGPLQDATGRYDAASDVPTGIRTLTPPRAAAAGRPPSVYRSS